MHFGQTVYSGRLGPVGMDEKIWLEQYQGPEVLFYRRYVDDTFCLFHSEQDAIAFFDYLTIRPVARKD